MHLSRLFAPFSLLLLASCAMHAPPESEEVTDEWLDGQDEEPEESIVVDLPVGGGQAAGEGGEVGYRQGGDKGGQLNGLDANTQERLKNLGYIGEAEETEGATAAVLIGEPAGAETPPRDYYAAPKVDGPSIEVIQGREGRRSESERKRSEESDRRVESSANVDPRLQAEARAAAEAAAKAAEQAAAAHTRDTREAEAEGEDYTNYGINAMTQVSSDAHSTFSIDVDTASYTIARSKLVDGMLPPTSSVRVEEFVNYFNYDYIPPTGDAPFSVNMEGAPHPFQPNHHILRFGVQAKQPDLENRKPVHLTFLGGTPRGP